MSRSRIAVILEEGRKKLSHQQIEIKGENVAMRRSEL
jgi:hypothetical protein